MVRRGHYRDPAVSFHGFEYPPVIGGYAYFAEYPGRKRPVVGPHDQRQALYRYERLSRKTRGTVAGGNDTENGIILHGPPFID